MILADTNVWSNHFRRGDDTLAALLRDDRVVTHTWIIGELALGPGMDGVWLRHLSWLPRLETVDDDDLIDFVTLHRLRGVGWVDSQLLLAALAAGADIWTRDDRLNALAARFGVAADI